MPNIYYNSKRVEIVLKHIKKIAINEKKCDILDFLEVALTRTSLFSCSG